MDKGLEKGQYEKFAIAIKKSDLLVTCLIALNCCTNWSIDPVSETMIEVWCGSVLISEILCNQ